MPHRDWMDAATPDHPVMVVRLDGHMVLANSLALELAGIAQDTADVAGGEIVRDEDGRPTGVLKDNAMNLVGDVVPAASSAEEDIALRAAMEYLASHGVTTVHDMSYDWQGLETYRRAHADDALTVRIHANVPIADWKRLAGEVAEKGRGDHWLTLGGVKGFMDGSLGSHTAAMFEPFTDPLYGIYAAVSRETLDGDHPDGWVPSQKVSVEDAMVAYTRNAAYAGFDEDDRGILASGMLADFVVLDTNIFAATPEQIRDAKVLRTVAGGSTVYSAP